MPAVFTNMILPDVTMKVNLGQFGVMENRMSHYGALNTFYNNTGLLFDEESLNKIRNTVFTQTVQIPIFEKYDHTVLTVRTCVINGNEIGVSKKTIIRVHLAFDVDITPAKYADNYVSWMAALAHKITMAKKAIYTRLDQMCAAYLDTNKDTTQTLGAGQLYTGVAGAYQVNKPLDFYNNLQSILEELDLNGPYFDVANTSSLADINTLKYPGGGAALDTKAIMEAAQIQQFEFTNRIARGTNRAVHYIAPVGSVGIINFIDYDYQQAPDLNALEVADEKELSEIKMWGQMNDNVFTDWKWGVLQEIVCVNEQRVYKSKQSADFALVCDFTSVAGESPIKRFEILNAQA